MIIKQDKNTDRQKRHARLRYKISGTAECPRMNVFKSNSEIYVQIIDDVAGKTLVSCNSLQKDIKSKLKGKNKTEQAKYVGEQAGKLAIKAGISEVVFDRGGYVYTGRVSAVADGAREAGLKF